MKENEVIDNANLTGFAKAAYTAQTKMRGYNLERLVQLIYGVNEGEEPTGKELTDKFAEFAYANRLRNLAQEAFKGVVNPKTGEALAWSDIKIDGKSVEETWGDKYAHVEDKSEKDMMYQLEVLHQVFEGTSQITAEAPGADPIVMVPAGSREAVKKEAYNEMGAARRAAQGPDDEEPVFDEPKVEAPKVEEKKDPLTAEGLDTFNDNIYVRVMRTNQKAHITTSPAAMLGVIFNGNPTAQQIIERYNKFELRDRLDMAAIEFLKEIDNPDRNAFLKEAGIDPATSFKVNGQTLEERYGEKYKNIELGEVKQHFYKLELMNEIANEVLLGKRGNIPEISADRYELKDGSLVPAETRKMKAVKPKVEPIVIPEEAPEVKEPTPEELRAELLNVEDKIIRVDTPAPTRNSAAITGSTVAMWGVVNQAYELHNKFKETLANLNAVSKNAIQGKDTALYGNMKTALENCIALSDLDNPQANPEKLMEAMETYRKQAELYHKNRKGLIFGPGSDAGKIRLQEAKNATLELPAKIEEMKKTIGLVTNPGASNASMATLAEQAMVEARNNGMDTFSINSFEGKFSVEYLEAAAKDYMRQNRIEITTQSIADLSLDGEFIDIVSKYPSDYVRRYTEFNAAKEALQTYYRGMMEDQSLSEEQKNHAIDMLRDRELSENASKLAENPEFLKVYKENGSLFPVAWARRAKAEAYLTQKNGTKPTAEEIKELSENKVFKMIVDKNPSNYAQKWDENDKKAEELGEKYKKELENMTYGLADYDSGLLGYVFNDYDPDSNPNPKFEEEMKKLKAIKKANKAEKYRIFEARENLEDIEDPAERQKAEEQLNKDADALEKSVKNFKNARNAAIKEHLLPEYVAKVAFLQATQNPRTKNNICRLMATEMEQEKNITASILKNIKKPENKALLNDKNLTNMLLNGEIVDKAVPGVSKPEPKKAAVNKKQPQKNVQAGGMGLH